MDFCDKLNRKNFLYKKNNTSLDSINNAKTDVRIFRDKSTDAFASVVLAENRKRMFSFIDYTYHAIYSHVIRNVCQKILAMNDQINKGTRRDIRSEYFVFGRAVNKTLKPMCGVEKLFYVFKGGSVMNVFYLDTVAKMFDPFINRDHTTQDLMNFYKDKLDHHYQHIFGIDENDIIINKKIHDSMHFTYNNEADKPGSPDMQDNIMVFLSEYIFKKFSVSDIDYSLYIATNNGDRYDILNNVVANCLGEVLSDLSNKFDQILDHVLNDTVYPIDDSIPIIESDDTLNDRFMEDDLLFQFKIIVANDSFIKLVTEYQKGNANPFFDMDFTYYDLHNNQQTDQIGNVIKQIINQIQRHLTVKSNKKYNKLFLLYTLIEFLYLVKYVNQLNGEILDLDPRINIDFLIDQLENHNDILLYTKFRRMVELPFYSKDILTSFKNKISNAFKSLNPMNNPGEFQPKIQKIPSPTDIKINVYKLIDQNIENANIDFIQRENCTLGWTNKLLKPIDIESSVGDMRYHYLSYNATIRKRRALSITDFDLIRIKLNLNVIGNHFTKNDHHINMPIPSEFIDISIPRYDDNSKIHYIKSCQNRNYDAARMKLKIGDFNAIVKAYNPIDIAEDLEYVLFVQNILEPWVDTKYTKRIIRLLFFIAFNSYIDSYLHKNKKYLDNFLTIIKVCHFIYLYTQDSTLGYPTDDVKPLIQNSDRAGFHEYLLLTKDYVSQAKNTGDLFHHVQISEKYHQNELFLKSILFWSFIYHNNDDQLFGTINMINKEFLWEPYHLKDKKTTIDRIKKNYQTLLNVIVTTGLKIHYLFQNIYNYQLSL